MQNFTVSAASPHTLPNTPDSGNAFAHVWQRNPQARIAAMPHNHQKKD